MILYYGPEKNKTKCLNQNGPIKSVTFHIQLLELIINFQGCIVNARIYPGTNVVRTCAPVQRMVFHVLQRIFDVLELVHTIPVKRNGRQ